jgi:hypothetical protein
VPLNECKKWNYRLNQLPYHNHISVIFSNLSCFFNTNWENVLIFVFLVKIQLILLFCRKALPNFLYQFFKKEKNHYHNDNSFPHYKFGHEKKLFYSF